MKNMVKKGEYKEFLCRVKEEIAYARKKAYQTVNRQLVELYLNIGKSIYEKIELSKWGAGIVEKLAEDLQREFPDMKGFSIQNLWRMKQIYQAYKDDPILSPVVRELSWTHNVVILHRTRSIEEKKFYLKTCVSERMTVSKSLSPIKVAAYKTKIIDKKLLERKLHSLPWPEF